MPTPTKAQQTPGYATLTIESVTVQNGIETGSAESNFIQSFSVDDFNNVRVNGVGEDPPETEVFAIGIHSRESGFRGIGTGAVGDASSLIGLKILEVGERTDVDVPIYPVAGLTNIQVAGTGRVEGSQSFPPLAPFKPPGEPEGPDVQAAVYNQEFSPGDESLPNPVATSDVVTVTGSFDPLNPEERPRLQVSPENDNLVRSPPVS